MRNLGQFRKKSWYTHNSQVIGWKLVANQSLSNYYYNWRCLKYPVWPFSLCPRQAQMADSDVATLVCPFGIWPGQGFYVELFLFLHFPLLIVIKIGKGVSWNFKQWKDIYLAPFLQNFKGPKNNHQFSIPSILWGKAKLSMASCS